jgi:hypothetical protein
MVRTTKEGDGQMNIDELENTQNWGSGWIDVLSKAILLDKVSIKDGKIIVKAFTEDEV